MQKRTSSNAARKAWNILRFALLWARKGGLFVHKRRLMMHLPKFIKTLGHAEHRGAGAGAGALYYGDRQLSFDDTPIIHVKMHRPKSMRFRLPCITPEVDFDYDFSDEIENNGEGEDEDDNGGSNQVCDEEGIDLKAEEFIAKFYEQLKLQRQVSYLQYN